MQSVMSFEESLSFAAVGVGLYLINRPLAAVYGSALAGVQISRILFNQDYKRVNRAFDVVQEEFMKMKESHPYIFPVGFISAAVIGQYSTLAGSVMAASLGVLRAVTYNIDNESDRQKKIAAAKRQK